MKLPTRGRSITLYPVAQRSGYPFGETRGTATSPTDRQFTGQRAETGLGSLYDYGARMYSPALGRFLSADTIVPSPADPQSLNRYTYVRNSPLNRIDPSGHVDCDKNLWGSTCESSTAEEKEQANICAQMPSFCTSDTSPGHLLDVALFTFGGIGLSALVPEVIGGGLDAVEGLSLRATVACANNPVCATLFGLGTKAGIDALNNFTQGVPDSFTESEVQTIQSGIQRIYQGIGKMFDYSKIIWWRYVGSSKNFSASANPGSPDISVLDNFFSLPFKEQVLTLLEEYIHTGQYVPDTFAVHQGEIDAQALAQELLKRIFP